MFNLVDVTQDNSYGSRDIFQLVIKICFCKSMFILHIILCIFIYCFILYDEVYRNARSAAIFHKILTAILYGVNWSKE